MNTVFTFIDGIIPLPTGALAKAEDIPTSVWPFNVKFESTPAGPAVIFLDTEEVVHHDIQDTASMDPKLIGQYFELMSERMAPEVAAHSGNNKKEMEKSTVCGCVNCLSIYPVSEITEWNDNGTTATCIYCKGNTLIGDASGYPIKERFLATMNGYLINHDDEPTGNDQSVSVPVSDLLN